VSISIDSLHKRSGCQSQTPTNPLTIAGLPHLHRRSGPPLSHPLAFDLLKRVLETNRMKPKSRKSTPSVKIDQSGARSQPLNWKQWLAVQLLILLVSSGATITVTIGDVGRVQVKVPPVASRTG
jgi:hypothetical protein